MLDTLRFRKILVVLTAVVMLGSYRAPVSVLIAPATSPLQSPIIFLPVVMRQALLRLYLPLVLKR